MFHGKPGEAWASWIEGYQRIYPPIPPAGVVAESVRCGSKPPADLDCPSLNQPHGERPACECVLFGENHARHRALCGAVWPRAGA